MSDGETMKKVLRKTGKIIGIAFSCIVAFLALLCIITLIWGAVQRSKGNVYNMLPETPSDFKPEIRLVVFTDTHKENENVADAIDTAYALFDNDEAYKGVDGFFCLGDISSIGGRKDYTAYKEALDGHVREETPCVTILGNHELKNKDEYYDIFKDTFGYEPDDDYDINGF